MRHALRLPLSLTGVLMAGIACGQADKPVASTLDRIAAYDRPEALVEAIVSGELAPASPSDYRGLVALEEALDRAPGALRERAQRSIANPGNAWHRPALGQLLRDGVGRDPFSGGAFVFPDRSADSTVEAPPWKLMLLRAALDDTRATRHTDFLRKDGRLWKIVHRDDHGYETEERTRLRDRSGFDDEWWLRVCDRAALLLFRWLGDRPAKGYHPLAKNREQVLEELRNELDRYQGCLRQVTHGSGDPYATSSGSAHLYPLPPPLERPATEADVVAGRAVFHLPDPGSKPDLRTPLVAQWIAPEVSRHNVNGALVGRTVLVLQVERDREGALRFGIADGDSFQVVPDRDIGLLRPLPGGGR